MKDKKNLKIPRRNGCNNVKLNHKSTCGTREVKLTGIHGIYTGEKRSELICRGLGGADNITAVTCCATRLRCTLTETVLVDEELLKVNGALGVIYKGNAVQVIYGPGVSLIRADLEAYLKTVSGDVKNVSNISPVICQAEAGLKVDSALEDEKHDRCITKTIVVSSPITGIAADLSTAPDEAFAGRMMGDGAVVIPTDPVVRAPEDGEVCFVFETKQAVGFQTDSGLGLLIHIGMDTVTLNGKGFEVCVENGQRVKKGDPMLKLDLDYLNVSVSSVASPVLCTEMKRNQKVRLLKEGSITSGEPLFALDFYG